MIIIFIIIAQSIYLILITYFRQGHYVKVDIISTRKDIALVLDYKDSKVILRLVIPRIRG